MKTEAQLVREIAKARSLSEQMALVEQLDALKQAQAAQARQDREVDLANTVISSTLSPVLTHSLHTAATDWLGEDDGVPQEQAHQAALAEGALWFQRLNPIVKSDRDEFAAQAFGMARRIGSKYGEHATAAERSFLDYVAFLQAREAASGLDQIQQTVKPDGVTPGATPMPEDTFDTFDEPVNEFNQGLDDEESSFNAPLLQEIIRNGPVEQVAQPTPSQHDTTDDYSNSYSEMPPVQSSLAIGHLYTLDDFKREASLQTQADSIPVAAKCPDCGGPVPPFRVKSGMIDCQRCGGVNPVPANPYEKSAAKTAKKCATPGCDGTVDEMGENYDHDNHDAPDKQRCPHCIKGRGPVKHSSKEAYTSDDWQDHVNNQSHQFGEEDLPSHLKPGDGYEDGMDDTGRSNSGENVRSSHSSAKEGASGLPQVQQTVDSFENPAPQPLPEEVAFPIVQPWPETTTGDAGVGVDDAIGRAEKAGEGQGQAEKPNQHGASRASDGLTIKPETRASKDFRKAYRYAQAWRPGMPLVNTGSAEFEAGVFAGLMDNPEGVKFAEASLASKHSALHTRIKMHASYLAKTAGTTVDLDTTGPASSPDASGNTPINGPGSTPELEGGMNPAAPGGPAPYNGTPPYGSPVTSNPGLLDPQNSTTTTEPMGSPTPFIPPSKDPASSVQTNAGLSPAQAAFRKRVQASKLADNRREG